MESAHPADHEILDDMSVTYERVLPHAPGTSHETYLDGVNEGLKPLEEYQEDFRPANILVKLAGLERLSEDEMLSILGHPEKTHFRTESGQDLPESSPHYLVIPADTSRLIDKFIIDQICVIDFGEAFQTSSPPDNLGVPESYLPPEVLFDEEKAFSQACDIWVLGCTVFEICEQIALFYMIFDEDELLSEIVRFFGKPPKEWWDKWEARDEFFDEQVTWLQRRGNEEWSLEVALSKPTEIFLRRGWQS